MDAKSFFMLVREMRTVQKFTEWRTSLDLTLYKNVEYEIQT